MGWRNVVLWVLQWAFGIYFVAIGVMHFVVPDGLPALMEWMYELNDTMHVIVGIAEILGGLGLILPSVTRIRPELTVYAAAGLVLVMAGAVVFHATRGEGASIVNNLIIAALSRSSDMAAGSCTPYSPGHSRIASATHLPMTAPMGRP